MKNAEQPLVSVITVNYNQTPVTLDFLKSVEKLQYSNLEIIVVDNHSNDNPALILDYFPAVNLVLCDRNLGFAGGNNIGIREAKGDFLLFVNNDTELPEDMLEPLLKRFASDPGIGMVSPKIKFYSRNNVIQYAGFTPVNQFTARNTAIGSLEQDQQQYDTARPTPYGHGAAMMLRKEAVQKAGFMPEVYFLYYEELDWCEMIRKSGYAIWYEPASVVYHKESLSTGKLSTLKTFFLTRNRLLFMKRNAGVVSFFVFLLYLSFITIPGNTLKYIIKKDIPNLKAFYHGLFSFIYPVSARAYIMKLQGTEKKHQDGKGVAGIKYKNHDHGHEKNRINHKKKYLRSIVYKRQGCWRYDYAKP